MSKNLLILHPVDMTRETMIKLEDKGLIHRIAPGNDVAGPVNGDNLGRSLYESDPAFGGHKLIVATIDAPFLRYFGCHDDNEDVWFLGRDTWRPLYFVVATCFVDEFADKVAANRLRESDLVCLRVRYNDPEASFFVMNKNVPHGEFILPTPAPSPSFYVAESTDLQIRPVSFGSVVVQVHDGDVAVTVSP